MDANYNVPIIQTCDADLRDVVRATLTAWAKYCPDEVKAAKEWLKAHKAAQSSKTGRTGEGEHVLGAFPGKVATALSVAFNDPHWMHNNPRALSIVFQEFEIGRFAVWEGTGREGAGAHDLELNSADKD